ncbi:MULTISPECIES: polysaccharide pyruvyl transferase CsaB [unclassified Leptolyngbya]|uniref:polysaccharide pyruvyl transferase CsaB n=1 Tax=unclassified Leptolyngbya TaxID=2650499 RepID=UPI001689A48D|nr:MULTISPECIES: polysaccharide pyruvyl transferase CsaB [unclassified Leptolyngbya]MBD1909484.1 polysaccharide pyruvyl transferase CsaB [Leptolyngbya sp. FACHB-8]MBD2153361.1 polysaccharide pyruvyl transferase CsaB [Leptolyngbya sp. FACHB-16]
MRAVLCGYYGMGNGGDEALLGALLQMLPPTVTPLVLSGNPPWTESRYEVEACDRKALPQVIRALRRADVFIWGGGSLMQDATSWLNPWYYGGLMALAQSLGLKTIAWAQGIGPLHRTPTRWLARQTFARCSAVSVRDGASAQLLSDWGIPVTLAPDPVWALHREVVPGLWDLPAPRVAVILRPHAQLTEARLEALTRALIDFQTATQVCILLVPFYPVQDLAIAQAIQPRLPGPSEILQLTHPQQLMGVFHGVEMAIAMRLHGLIMAAAAECRCFALSYDPKVSRLMEELNLAGWTLDEIPDSPAKITHAWLEVYANGDALLPEQRSSLVDRALLHKELLWECLS